MIAFVYGLYPERRRVEQYRSFPMYVSPYPIDYGVVYRKLAPGYEVYSKMGIYERDLASFEERPLLENTMVPGMCLNCHASTKQIRTV